MREAYDAARTDLFELFVKYFRKPYSCADCGNGEAVVTVEHHDLGEIRVCVSCADMYGGCEDADELEVEEA